MNNQKLFRLLRTAALLTAISLFSSLVFEAFHTGHEANCHEEECPVCIVLQIIGSTEKIGQSSAQASVEFTHIFFINVIIFSALLLGPATLVKQKIKLVI